MVMILGFVLSVVAGFVAGALVYRKHAVKLKEVEVKLKQTEKKLQHLKNNL